ncbi:MAG TPA: glycosyltransferase family 4 protein [Bryobacteraceae bacterium]|nr:glycosyltransferase family 4 protein [Bryobacteraceae bacterium]
MRVLHVDSGKSMRGGQWQVLYLMQEQGTQARLLCPENGPLMEAARERGMDVQALNVTSLARSTRKADITHVHDARAHTWAASMPSTPMVVSRRVAFPIGQSFLSRWKYARAAHYIAVSEYVKQTLIQGEIDAARISVVHDGVNTPDPVTGGTEVVALDTGDPMKGSALLREAASLAGVDILFTKNLQMDLPRAAIFVYITHSEGLGSAALMAMAAGVPVVASRVGGLPEIVKHGETGLLTENDPHSIAAAIQQALEGRSSMCCRAREHATLFSTAAMAAGTRRVYERVLA